ncbi:MAG: glycosyltransferase family 2 protein [Deltaproteobacteria bacterium HGW-Deltaproteobacteria-13]|jgi:glycosyltransferase involved in cell wall biosynthesis|nr:MAG: glycosyltransferase family 2 protein [Deltaproteobacteria bacterium HGW-Deltaproteobacteria-13]
MNSNLVSVIIPVFNAEKYVAEAIGSVLSQTYKNMELICINDKSTDHSFSILESFENKIILINNENNCGTAESRNKGIRIARGEFLAFIDNDDIWESHKLEVQMNEFRIHPALDVSFSYMQSFISPELSEKAPNLRYCPSEPIPGYIPSTIVVKRTSLAKAGYFDSRWKNGESVDWMFKAKEAGLNFGVVDQVLVKRRIHETNKGVLDSATSKNEYLKIIRESVNRRRKNKPAV